MGSRCTAGPFVVLAAAFWTVGPGARAEAPATKDAAMFPPPKDLMDDVPPRFPRFFFTGHQEEAQCLSRYLWYHFSKRGGAGKCMFNQEYVTTSDMWMGDGVHPRLRRPIQDVHREMLRAVCLDEEGYVNTHQHFSHAHEQGWPFPMWTQAPPGPKGPTAGWHFQDDGPGWVWQHYLRRYPDTPHGRAKAIDGWTLENVRSLGIVDKKWRLEATEPSPAITTPTYVTIDALNAPFLQLRWTRTPKPPPGVLPYIEWLGENDTAFGPDRRVHFGFDTGNPDYQGVSKTTHSQIRMHRHSQWKGRIKRIRICLAPGESSVKLAIDSFFTVYDTRHTINNPIYIMACWNAYRWTGDLVFLGDVINKMRIALRYQQTVLGGLKHNHIRNPWVGHDGLPGFKVNPDGTKTMRYGHGIGNNYWDLMPFGWDDMYSTSQYYAATRIMADVEQAVLDHPEWDIPRGALALDPDTLRKHAAAVKKTANEKFWNAKTGRFIACVDKEGGRHDYGYTFLNLDAIWYGIASDDHARSILDWLTGKRIVEGDTSTGADIYHWRFGPRASTRRNVEWYGQGWTAPESIAWGGQIQDGGGVLGFAFYDFWAYLHVVGPDAAWRRLGEMLTWEKEVWAEGGYRKYFEGGKHGTTLQGGGTAGGIGVDCEFWESSLIPSIVICGFLGLDPDATALAIRPRLPKACPEIGVSNVFYRGVRLDIKATNDALDIGVNGRPRDPIQIVLEGQWQRQDTGQAADTFPLASPGIYRFKRGSDGETSGQ